MKGVKICSLTHNTLRIERRVEAPGRGLGRMTSESIIHTTMHKLNNKLVNA